MLQNLKKDIITYIVNRDKGVTPKQIAACAKTLLPGKGGIGIYSTFCHVDVRAAKSRWNG